MRTCKGMGKRSLVTEKEWNRLRDAVRRGKAVSIDLEYTDTRIRLSTSKAPPVWRADMLVRVETWRPRVYTSQYFPSVEEAMERGV